MKFFHLTPSATLDQILRDGLDPRFSRSSLQAIFLAGTRSTAENYSGMKDQPCVVVEVDLPLEFLNHLQPDNYELRDLLEQMEASEQRTHGLDSNPDWRHCTWQQSLSICDQVACTVKIPAKCLTPIRPEFAMPTQEETIQVLRKHPLIRLREKVNKAYLVGGFAKAALGLGQIHPSSDVDVLLEVAPREGFSASDLEQHYRMRLMSHFMKHRIEGRQDDVHPQWCGRRVDVYFTHDASLEDRPKIQLYAPPTPSSRHRRP